MIDDTIIVFTTDHGTHLGEEGYVQKSPELLNSCVTHLPLIIKHPDKKFTGKTVDGLVSTIDFMSTFLNLLGIDDYNNMDGENMWKLVTDQVSTIHDEYLLRFLIILEQFIIRIGIISRISKVEIVMRDLACII